MSLSNGITPYQIEGWLFRNDDNTAPRKPSEMMTPAIGEKREFQFVLTAAAEEKSCADVDKMEHIYDENDPERIAATNRFGAYAGGDGSVTITSLTLGNLKPSARRGSSPCGLRRLSRFVPHKTKNIRGSRSRTPFHFSHQSPALNRVPRLMRAAYGERCSSS